MNKPKLSSNQIVEKIEKEKGITFKHITKEEAAAYLTEKNNYYRLASYRKNYDKILLGENEGKYINLDFSYLIDLSSIDMQLRFLIIRMCLDIEHDLKIRLLNDITKDDEEDGYSIVKDFVDNNDSIMEDIFKKRNSTYVGDLISNFFTFEYHLSIKNNIVFDRKEIRCPVWAFVEIISFGSFIKFYDYYYGDRNTGAKTNLLNPIKSLRNACAHNNCLLNNLRSGCSKPSSTVSKFVSQINGISKDERKKYLSVRPIFEFVSLLIVYDSFVSQTVKEHRYLEMNELVNNRMSRNSEYYQNQQLLKASYLFIQKIVDFLV